MRQHRALAVVALIALIVGMASGCAPAASTDSRTQAEDWTQQAELVWQSADRLVSPVRVVDGVPIAYVAKPPQEAELVAWDPATGHRLWSAPVRTSTSTAGLEHQVAATQIDGVWTVAHLGPISGYRDVVQALYVRDARTGAIINQRTVGAPMMVDRPEACTGGYCVVGVTAASAASATYRWIAAEDRIAEVQAGTSATDGLVAPSGRALGSGVSESRSSGEEILHYADGGDFRWQQPSAVVFGAASSSDWGWSWNRHGGVLVGWGLAGLPEPGGDGRVRVDLATSNIVVGVDPADGRVLWRAAGIGLCPGAAGSETLTFCRMAGTMLTATPASGDRSAPEFTDLRVEVVRISATTGAVRWAVQADADPRNVWELDRALPEQAHPVAFIAGRATAIDLDSGTTAAAPDGATLLCSDKAAPEVQLRKPSLSGGSGWQRVPEVLTTCTPAGTPRSGGTLTRGSLRFAGLDPDGAYVNLVGGVALIRVVRRLE